MGKSTIKGCGKGKGLEVGNHTKGGGKVTQESGSRDTGGSKGKGKGEDWQIVKGKGKGKGDRREGTGGITSQGVINPWGRYGVTGQPLLNRHYVGGQS